MSKKTISDPLYAIRDLRTTLKLLTATAEALNSSAVHVPRTELIEFHAAVATARELYNDTAEYTWPQVKATIPEDIGTELYEWFVEKIDITNLQAREKVWCQTTFLNSQLGRWLDSKDQARIMRGFWNADEAHFAKDLELGRDTQALRGVLAARFESAKPNSDCTLEVWAHSALIRLEATVAELQEQRSLLGIPGLLTCTDEDNGVVTLEFQSEDRAQNFIANYGPTVEYEELSRTERSTIDNNRTIRNAESNEGKPYFKYRTGALMRSRSGFFQMHILHRLQDEVGGKWYMLSDAANYTVTRSELELASDWLEVTLEVTPAAKWKFSVNDLLRQRHAEDDDSYRIQIDERFLSEDGRPVYQVSGAKLNRRIMTEEQIANLYKF